METIITGKAYVLGDNIDTDQIIPAQYLSFNPSLPEERKFFGMYANSGVPENQAGLPQGKTPFVRPNEFKSDYTIVIGGTNFIQQKMMPMQGDPAQQKMMLYLMPGIFIVMMLFLPSGLGVYMFTNGVLGIVQQQLVERHAKRAVAKGKTQWKGPEERKG